MKSVKCVLCCMALLCLSSLAFAQAQFAGKWQTKISPATGKHLFTVNLEVRDKKVTGTVVLVDPVDGNEIESDIFNAEQNTGALEFETKVRQGTFHWRLTLAKGNREGLLHGNVGELVIDERVVKQRQ